MNRSKYAKQQDAFPMTTLVVTGLGVTLLAPELLPGMAVGVGAILAPRALPYIKSLLRSVVKTGFSLGYSAAYNTKEVIDEAGEEVEEIEAEARDEETHKLRNLPRSRRGIKKIADGRGRGRRPAAKIASRKSQPRSTRAARVSR
jgi:hypothetical protein